MADVADGALPSDVVSPPQPAAVPAATSSLRILPAVVLAALQWAVILVPGRIAPGTMFHFMTLMFGPMVCTALIVLWWLFFTRTPARDRWLVFGVAALGGLGAWSLCDRTMPMMLMLYGMPAITTVWMGWLAVTGRMSWPARRAGLMALILLAWAYHVAVRVDGVDGSITATTSWRWTPTAEQEFLASLGSSASRPSADSAEGESARSDESASAELSLAPGDWPSFRGPKCDSRLEGTTISDNWNESPPKQIWKHRLGPGWGSFAVVGDRLFTQEQRGEDEAVVCYGAGDGQEMWIHRDATRFWEVVGGAGPRATPTFHEGRLYTVGANGRLNCLEAATGKRVWGVDMIESAHVKVPDWGYASSPLIVGATLFVLPGRPEGAALQAYDLATGNRLWSAGDGTHSYSSPQRAEIDGVTQILALTDTGLDSIAPDSGEVLWSFPWSANGGARCLQPFVDGNLIVATTYFGVGSRGLRVSRLDGQWQVDTEWQSQGLKPYFNDLVVQKGHAYGFDANILCCIDVATGKRKWKGGRYGYGQVLLIADQDLLLVLSETGEAVLVKADPQQHVEVCRFQAIEGKTWNHPVVAHNRLYVRNAEEMASYDVTPQK